jgi:arginyl-tRNA synthetase
MANPVDELSSRLSSAIESAFGSSHAGVDPVVRRSAQPQFGDYQANFAMSLAKSLGQPPRAVAEAVVGALDVSGLSEPPTVAGPGFVNFRLSPAALSAAVTSLLGDPRVGVAVVEAPERVVVDYSSPNLAKEMHIGHLRSTIIGDALARVLAFVGHDVVRQNHFGEWGTQFGMLIEHLIEVGAAPVSASASASPHGDVSVADLNAFYREANARFKSDESFASRARARVVKMQSGDEESLALWRRFVAESHRHANEVYARLGVLLTDDDIRAESSYNPMLVDVARDLEAAGVAVVDDGALVVFSPRYDAPLLVRKRDGGYMYGTTDLAAIRYRTQELGGTWLVYVVGAPQTQHLDQVFEAARAVGWLAPPVRAVHVAFGSVLGPDRRMYKTRSGENIRLTDLLDEAVLRAAAKVADAAASLPADEQAAVARAVGIGAVKYADLASDRVKDYVFDWDRMLAFEGNTGPYLQYAHARIRSIFRRAEVDAAGVLASLSSLSSPSSSSPSPPLPIHVDEPAERELVLQLLGFDEAVTSVAETLQPHRLCTYLFDLAQAFTAFYESCPVLRAPDEPTRVSRLALSELTARTLALGLSLLGIEAPARM